MRSKADETFVIVEILICPLQISHLDQLLVAWNRPDDVVVRCGCGRSGDRFLSWSNRTQCRQLLAAAATFF